MLEELWGAGGERAGEQGATSSITNWPGRTALGGPLLLDAAPRFEKDGGWRAHTRSGNVRELWQQHRWGRGAGQPLPPILPKYASGTSHLQTFAISPLALLFIFF